MADYFVYQYWRNPTEGEIKFGYGCLHFVNLTPDECLKKDGTPKKWLNYGGMRYNYDQSIIG
jgi:hypothetical protein